MKTTKEAQLDLVIGKKNSGKTDLIKQIINKPLIKQCRVLVLDINDEYSDLKNCNEKFYNNKDIGHFRISPFKKK